jgi:hypothetical protein
MIVLQMLLVVFCFLVMAAHFMRAGAWPMMLLSFALLSLLAVARPWAGRVLQGWLVLGCFVWIMTGISFATDRLAQGKPAFRLMVIMGSVALVSALAASTIQRGRLGRYFGLK